MAELCVAPVEWDEQGPCVFVHANGDVCECLPDDCMHTPEEGRLSGTSEHDYVPPVGRVCGLPITGSGPCATCGGQPLYRDHAYPNEAVPYFERVGHVYAPSVFTCAAGHAADTKTLLPAPCLVRPVRQSL